jgi:multicomponent Na+:H+ antiporter subunit A
MLTPLFNPMLVFTLGALLLLLLGSVPRMWGLRLLAIAVAGLALAALAHLGTLLPVEGVASVWRPQAVFGAPLSFEADASSWSLAMVLGATSFLSLLACYAGSNHPPTGNVVLILLGSGVGVMALFATSFVALLVTWGATDIVLSVALARHGVKGARRAGLALFSGSLATIALWAAPLLAPAEGASVFIDLAHFTGSAAQLLRIAVVLRLGLVPLHLWRPIDLDTEPAQLIPLLVIPTLLGFDLLTHLPTLTAGLPSILFALSALTALVGGFVAWSETDERLSLAGVMVAQTGLAVLAVVNAGQQAVAIVIAAAIAWALGITLFALPPGWSGRYFWRGLPSLLALLSLLGLPSTLGFVARFTVYNGLEADVLALAVALLGEIFLVAAMIRLWFWAEPRPLPGRLLEAPYLLVFGLAAAALFWLGLSPDLFVGRGQDTALPGLSELLEQGSVAGWAGWALPLIAGLILFLVGEGLRQRLEGGWRGLGALLKLEWVYGLFYLFLRQLAHLMRGVSSVVEGEGALLWTMVILLIVLLYLNGGAPAG